MNGQTEVRASNFELLRIFAMLMIVFGHAICHGGEVASVTDSLFSVRSII